MKLYTAEYKSAADSSAKAVVLEDCIMKKDSPAASGSRILENFVSPFDATVIDRLISSGYEISAKADMPEFGLPELFKDVSKEKGQSPAPAVEAVLQDTRFCLCNDLFGSYRRQAAENNLCYLSPTYGTVSRYGLIPMASSMDQIGVLCRDLTEGFELLQHLAGKDPRDGAMYPQEKYSYKPLDRDIKLCIPSNVTALAEDNAAAAMTQLAQSFDSCDTELSCLEAYKQVMYILSCAEISNNISRYDGVKFGYRSPEGKNLESMYTRTRTEGFGTQAKLAAIMGAYVLSGEQYQRRYEKAMKLRRMIYQSLPFDSCDVIALPASIPGSLYDNLALYALPALAGLPSVSFSLKGQGVLLIADVKNESALLKAWEAARS